MGAVLRLYKTTHERQLGGLSLDFDTTAR